MSDAVNIAVGARLIGVSADRVRQLVRAGLVHSPARGQVGMASLLRGYAASLRQSAAAPASAALARSQAIKAQIVAAEVAARKAELVETVAATDLIEGLCEIAVDHIGEMVRPPNLKGFPQDVAARIRDEAHEAKAKIEAAAAVAVSALTSGDFEEIDP
ncbi:hypothetical protein G5B31_20690 [Rhodobacter sp. SGA-6-6]|uniref:hypothetical protein n=1 Tax=Rhodobacter sp. SGA-6-6 TaxID=2710882 RepID=UPI0013EDD61E|nr:hypothetical protein [Rhodobacter sp. SGA-6-6]NGM47939.1 hypothetical protein [Rhodobacter sp. SGA-6-6]